MTDRYDDNGIAKVLRCQRRFGLALFVLGVLGLMMTPFMPLLASATGPSTADGSSSLSEEDVKELREQIEEGDYRGFVSNYPKEAFFGNIKAMFVLVMVFGLPALSLLLIMGGGYMVTQADKNGHLLDLDDYPDNPSVRDEFRDDDN